MKFLKSKGVLISLSPEGGLKLSPPELVQPEILAYVRANAVRLRLELVAKESVSEHSGVDSHGINPPCVQESVQKPEAEEGYFNILDELISEGRYKNPLRRGNSSLVSGGEAEVEWNWAGYEGFL
jgi:hypothetical protein